jgi:hypothetical protein
LVVGGLVGGGLVCGGLVGGGLVRGGLVAGGLVAGGFVGGDVRGGVVRGGVVGRAGTVGLTAGVDVASGGFVTPPVTLGRLTGGRPDEPPEPHAARKRSPASRKAV